MTTQAIIFDFGNVLDFYEELEAWNTRRDALAAQFNLSGKKMWDVFYQGAPWQEVKKGRISYPEFWDRTLTPLGMTDPAAQADFVARLFEGRVQIHPSMEALLRELKPHYRLAILSNTYEVEMETWLVETFGLVDIFNAVVSSAKVGLAKPEPEIYQLTLDMLGIAPDEALFIDDLPRNTKAAEALGIPSIIFESPAQLRHELQERGILPTNQPILYNHQ
ncbi:MAG: HAD family phosphatase [Chloroflexota bacterium]